MKGSSLKEGNLLLEEQVLSFKSLSFCEKGCKHENGRVAWSKVYPYTLNKEMHNKLLDFKFSSQHYGYKSLIYK